MPESLVYLLYCHYLLDYSLSSLLSTLVDLICISITNNAGHVSMGLLAICIALIKHLFNYFVHYDKFILQEYYISTKIADGAKTFCIPYSFPHNSYLTLVQRIYRN